MTRILFLLFLSIFYLSGLSAQQLGTISGSVTDSTLNEALLGVNVILAKKSTTTDYVDGKYEIQVTPGNYKAIFSYVGYASKTVDVIIEANKTTTLNIQLTEQATLLQTATVTGGRFEKPLGEVTVSLEVIQPKLLENTNATSIDQVLEKVPGVNTMGDQVTIRGGAGFAQGTGSRVLILLDDMPAMQADAGLPNWSDLPTENIGQLEVLKGAASALYGSSALNGVINVRTATPKNHPETKISIFSKFYDNPKTASNKWWGSTNFPYQSGIQFAHRRKIKKLDLVTGGNIYSSRSIMRGVVTELDRIDNTTTLVNILDSMPGYSHKLRLTTNLRYRISERLNIGLNSNLNTGLQSTFLFWRNDIQVASAQFYDPNLKYGLYESNSAPSPRGRYIRFNIDPSITYYDKNENRHRGQFRYSRILNNNENMQSNSSNMLYGEYQLQRTIKQLGDLKIAAGLVGSTVISVAEVYSNETYQHSNFAGYAQVDKKFFDRLNLSAGVRYEANKTNYPAFIAIPSGNQIDTVLLSDTLEHKPIFRAGANYRLGIASYLRTSWGQGYRYPTILERFISTNGGGATVLPNPNLNSEYGSSFEIGFKQGFKFGKWKGFLDIASFWSYYEDMMEFQFAPGSLFSFQVQNIGNTKISGYDISLMGQGKIGKVDLTILSGYTYLNPTYQNFDDSLARAEILSQSTSKENILKYRNRHTIKFDGQATYKRISIGVTCLYLSHMEAVDKFLGDPFLYYSIYEFREKHNKGSLVVHARVAYQISKLVKASFLIENVLNNEYSFQPGRLEAPRSFSLRADFSF